ncbi:MAG: 30S ribosomal protein S12 methylthiotransferase RimO [Proteobacteria bacterium]|nr:30S ribosomal protein S12 methylthiotransferase RimO [Pseudomonadota bacterium]
MKIHLVSLGCAKNLVDSEIMLGRLMQTGWTHTSQPEIADVIIINTCSFIESAIDESIDTILELSELKHTGTCRRLIVTGCLPERFREQIVTSLPEVDFFLGTGAYSEIVNAAQGPLDPSGCLLPDPDGIRLANFESPRQISSPHTAYLKIAEGCSRHCTYCIIPKLRGKHKSRSPQDIVAEARNLIRCGVRELTLIAQDTTAYGNDLNPPVSLDILLENISAISENVWIRLLYGHPESLDISVVRTIAKHQNLCPYFDIPVQHAADRVLKKMGRNYTSDDLRGLFYQIRSIAPDAALRTTVIVGFPGESDDDFEALMNFAEEIRFDHLGVFVYSDSKDLPSHRLSGHVPLKMARNRRDRLMTRQAQISLGNNRKHIGRVYSVLVEAATDNDMFIGRTCFQAPEVDGITYIHSRQLKAGTFARVRITDALEYDLIGETA